MYREIIDKQIASAMKNGEHVKLTVWRSIKSEFVKYITSGSGVELTDEKELQIISKMVQQRKESLEQYISANRTDLASVEEQEMTILQALLPIEPTEDDINDRIKEYLETISEKPTMKHMRDVMTFVKSKYPTVNGGVVSKLFKENYI